VWVLYLSLVVASLLDGREHPPSSAELEADSSSFVVFLLATNAIRIPKEGCCWC